MKRKAPKVVRTFLNPRTGMASVQATVNAPGPYHLSDEGYGGSLDASLSLSDCGRQVTLDFDAYDEKDVKERLAKIDKIRAALKIIEDGLIEYYFEAGVLTDAERKAARLARDNDEDWKKEERTIRVTELLEDIDGL